MTQAAGCEAINKYTQTPNINKMKALQGRSEYTYFMP